MRAVSLVLAVAIALLIAPLRAQTLEAELQRAIQKEMVSGNLKASIEDYRKIAARAGDNRAVKARALLRMADAYRKLGDVESRALYERVVKEFADQKDLAAEARTRLGAPAAAARVSGPAARQLWSGENVDPMGQVSADGRILTYTDWSSGDLGVRDLASGTNRRVTNTGGWEASGDFAEFSVPSPDGREVAYAWFTDKRTGQLNYNLRFLSIGPGDAAKPRMAERPDDLEWVMPCSWTPDGKHVVVFRERRGPVRELGLVNVATGVFRLLKTMPFGPQRANVSPDGQWIAYDASLSANTSERDLFVIKIDGGSETRIDANPSNDQMPMWTSDGSGIVFLSDRTSSNGLWTLPVRAGKPAGPAVMVKQDVGAFYPLGLTRAGAVVYFVGGDRINNYVVGVGADLKPTNAPAALTNHFVNSNVGASWSPDGRRVAFIAFRGREAAGAVLIVRAMDTGEEREIPLTLQIPRGGNLGSVRWFPDGQSVLVVSRDARDEGLRYMRITLATGAAELVHRTRRRGPGIAGPALSPDGSAIVYLDALDGPSSVGDGRAIRRFDLASRQETVLKETLANSVSLSPDGKWIAYVFRDSPDARESQLGIMPAAGGETRVVYRSSWLDVSRFNALGWSRDGRFVMFVRQEADGGNHLYRVPVEGGTAEKTGLSARGQMKAPQVSPDGTRLLYSVRDLSENSVWILENFLAVKRGT